MRLKGEKIMTKMDFIRRVANRADATITSTTKIYEAMMEELCESMINEEKVPLQGVGSLCGVVKESHPFYNIKTKKKEVAPAKKKIKFTPSTVFVKSMNE